MIGITKGGAIGDFHMQSYRTPLKSDPSRPSIAALQVDLNYGPIVRVPPSGEVPDDREQYSRTKSDRAEVHRLCVHLSRARPEREKPQYKQIVRDAKRARHFPWAPLQRLGSDHGSARVVRTDALEASPEEEGADNGVRSVEAADTEVDNVGEGNGRSKFDER
jgi:hypothetical protein